MKKITVTLDDETALAVLALLVDRRVDSLQMESAEAPHKPRYSMKRRVAPADPTLKTLHKVLADNFHLGNVFTREEAATVVERNGYAPTGAASTLSRLQEHGFVNRDNGNYKFVKTLPPGWRMPHKGKSRRRRNSAQRELAV